jgi:hypothetical protein
MRGRAPKYATEEERKQAKLEQNRNYRLRKRQELMNTPIAPVDYVNRRINHIKKEIELCDLRVRVLNQTDPRLVEVNDILGDSMSLQEINDLKAAFESSVKDLEEWKELFEKELNE